MLDLWDIMRGSGSHDEDSMKLVNVKWLICALEGISTNKLLKKSTTYNGDRYRDENNNFYADEAGVKRLLKRFSYAIQNKVTNQLWKHTNRSQTRSKSPAKKDWKFSKVDEKWFLNRMMKDDRTQWIEEERKRKHEKTLKECSFKPSLMTKNRSHSHIWPHSAMDHSVNTDMDRCNELYQLSKREKSGTRDKTTEEIQFEKEVSKCTFHPSVNPRSGKKVSKWMPIMKMSIDSTDAAFKKSIDRMRNAREEKLEIQKLRNRGVTKSTATFIGYDFEADKKLKQAMWRKKRVKSFAGSHHLKATESSNWKKNQKSMC